MRVRIQRASLYSHMLSNLYYPESFVYWRELPGPPWEMASGSHFSYTLVFWRELPGPSAEKFPPEATSPIHLCSGGILSGKAALGKDNSKLSEHVQSQT